MQLTKPAWQHRNADRRIAALAELPENERPSIAKTLLETDENADVRKAAAAICADLEVLNQARKQDESSTVQSAAFERYLDLVSGASADAATETERLAWLQKHPDPEIAERLITSSQAEAIRLASLPQIDRPALLGDVSLNDKAETVRLAALKKIDHRPTLERVMTQSRTSDKAIYRQAESQLETLKLAAGDPEAINAKVEALSLEAERLTKEQQPLAAIAPLEAQWHELSSLASKAANERFERASRIFNHLHNPAPVKTETAEPDSAEEKTSEASSTEQKQTPQTIQYRILQSATDSLNNNSLLSQKRIDQYRQQWKEAKTKPSLSEQGQFDSLLVKLEKTLATQQAEKKRLLAEAKAQLTKCREKLDAGEFNDARSAFQTADGILEVYESEIGGSDSSNEVRKLAGRLSKLYSEIRHLEGWQHYGNNRERRDLCAQMENLAQDEKIHPEERAKRVKAAQSEWKRLEEIEKGADGKGRGAGAGLWRRFQSACNQAWEPCKAHFDKQSAERQKVLDKIEPIVAELEKHRDNPKDLDPKRLNELTKGIGRARRDMRHMPRRETRKLEKRINAVMKAYDERIDSIRKRNEGSKRQLIQKARLIQREPELRKAINDIKRLQRDWKQTGPAERKADQALWEEFRGICDEIFAKQKAKDAERDAAFKEKREQADAALKELKALTEAELDGGLDANLKRLRGLWEELGMERDAKRNKQFRSLVKTIDQRRKAARQAAKTAAREQSAALAGLVSEAEMRAETGKTITKALAEKWSKAKLPDDDSGKADLGKALKKRWKAAEKLVESGKTPDAKLLAENAEQGRDLVIRLELAAELDSPAEDQQRRIALRVGQLSNALSGGAGGNAGPEQLLAQWQALGPIPHEIREGWEARVAKAAEKI